MATAIARRTAALEKVLAGVTRAGNRELGVWLREALPGGKRLRARLLFLCAEFATHDAGEALRAAAAVELIHLASLVHDDILDHAATRRGRLSLYRWAGVGGAVMAGDYLFASAFELLATVRPQVLADATRAIRLMCEGEIEEQQRRDLAERSYYTCITKKTASLLAAACCCGGHLCGLPPHQVDYLGFYGLSLGTAFQIVDDVLDLTADSRRLGKPTRHDLTQGIVTLPVIAFLEHSPRAAEWRQRIQAGGLTGQQVTVLAGILEEEGYLARAVRVALEELELSRLALAALPAGPAREELAGIAARLPNLDTVSWRVSDPAPVAEEKEE